VADRPRTGDDDEAPRLPEVTVPPWLRSGPTPVDAARSGPAVDRPGGADEGAGAPRAGSSDPEARTGTRPPARITLGVDRGRGADRAAEAAHPVVEAAHSATGGPAAGGPAADGLSTLSLAGPVAGDAGRAGAGAAPDEARDEPVSSARSGRRPLRIAVAVASAAAVVGGSAVLGYVITSQAVAPVAEADVGCEEVSEPGRVAGAGPGSPDTPAGSVLAFDHAYYVERSASAAFEVVSPSSRMTEEQLRVEGIERLAEGTTHCVEVRELSPTLLDVELTEYPPDADPVLIRQRVRVEETSDGGWGIVSITPAG
jgi:hypothetical protein